MVEMEGHGDFGGMTNVGGEVDERGLELLHGPGEEKNHGWRVFGFCCTSSCYYLLKGILLVEC